MRKFCGGNMQHFEKFKKIENRPWKKTTHFESVFRLTSSLLALKFENAIRPYEEQNEDYLQTMIGKISILELSIRTRHRHKY